ncbi:MAG: signal peptidase I [Actinomycetota bacterium]|nr:signal peptidase I [Actinomycetota bacterium]
MSEPAVGSPRRRRWALDLAAAFGVVCLGVLAASHVVGVRPLIVAGSSMEPSLPLDSLAVSVETPAQRLVVGDVVSVVRDDGARVTHRVVDLEPVARGAGLTELTLQGDANASPDATRPVEMTVDRVVWTVPGLGGALRALRSPTATFVLGALVGVAVWTAGRGRARRTGAVLWIDDVPYQVLP